jgi:hypothetical protein
MEGKRTYSTIIPNACEYTAVSAVICEPMVAFEKAFFGDESGGWGGGHVGGWYLMWKYIGVLSGLRSGDEPDENNRSVCVLLLKVEVTWRA